jgi:hypothetical protein
MTGLLIPAELMSESVCFEPISKRFVSGHDFSRAEKASKTRALAPVALSSPSGRLRGSVRQLNLLGGHYLCGIQ